MSVYYNSFRFVVTTAATRCLELAPALKWRAGCKSETDLDLFRLPFVEMINKVALFGIDICTSRVWGVEQTNKGSTTKHTMNFATVFENALDVAELNLVPFLPELNSEEIDFVFASQLSDFTSMMDARPAEESEDDDLNELVNAVRKTRITIGFTQSEMARSITTLCGKKISQTTVCRFEGKILPKRNLRRLRPTFERWIQLGRTNPASLREASFNHQRRVMQCSFWLSIWLKWLYFSHFNLNQYS